MRNLPTEDTVTIPMTRAEALVLVEWLTSFAQEGNVPTNAQAELVVLWRIHAHLEHVLHELNDPEYVKLVAEARNQVCS
jgi:hypothetical protein